MLVRTAPEVGHVTVILASGSRRAIMLSPVIEDFGLRFGAAPMPDNDPPACIEVDAYGRDPEIFALRWPPPRGNS